MANFVLSGVVLVLQLAAGLMAIVVGCAILVWIVRILVWIVRGVAALPRWLWWLVTKSDAAALIQTIGYFVVLILVVRYFSRT